MRTRARRGGTPAGARGFSLVEIAIVLAILGLLLRATLVPLATLREAGRERAAREGVEAARLALLAHAVTHGSLPCPLPAGSPGRAASRAAGRAADQVAGAGGRCAAFVGVLPSAVLGLAGPVDAAGAALDPWGRALVYAVSDADADGAGTSGRSDWTVPGEPRAVGIAALAGSLVVCRVAGRGACPAHETRADDLAFVVLSHGADPSALDLQERNARAGASGASGAAVFTLAPRSAVQGHRFDDLLAWGSRGEIVMWWLRAGRLP